MSAGPPAGARAYPQIYVTRYDCSRPLVVPSRRSLIYRAGIRNLLVETEIHAPLVLYVLLFAFFTAHKPWTLGVCLLYAPLLLYILLFAFVSANKPWKLIWIFLLGLPPLRTHPCFCMSYCLPSLRSHPSVCLIFYPLRLHAVLQKLQERRSANFQVIARRGLRYLVSIAFRCGMVLVPERL